MANFMAEKLGVKTVYILDDSGAYGVGLADAFQAQAEKKGVKVARPRPAGSEGGRLHGGPDQDQGAQPAGAVLRRRRPGRHQAGQAGLRHHSERHQGGRRRRLRRRTFLTGAGFPAAEGWYATIASPHLTGGDRRRRSSSRHFTGAFGVAPEDYSITAYDAALVIIDAVKRVAASGKPVTRDAVRDAIQTAKVPTIQGTVSFDANGDLRTAPSACSRSSRTRPASRWTTCRRSTTTSTWRRRPDRPR